MKFDKAINYIRSAFDKRLLISVTNIIYVTVSLLRIYKYNQEYFFENAFSTVNIIFYGYVLLSLLFIKNIKLYFFSSLFLILDFPTSLKYSIEGLPLNYINFHGALNYNQLSLFFLLCIFSGVTFLVFRFKVLRYFQIYLLVFYTYSLISTSLKPKIVHDSSLRLGYKVSSISKNYYFFLFDEYPGEKVIRQYNLCGPSDYPSVLLNKEGFENDQNIYSNYTSTQKSTLTFLTGSFQANNTINQTIHAIYKNSFTNGSNYSFYAFSPFDNQNRPNSGFSTFYFQDFYNLSTRKVIPFFIKLINKKGAGRNTDWDVYNGRAVSKLATLSKINHPHVVYIHLFSPHSYPLIWKEPESERIKNANQWMLKTIKLVNANDPSAGVIIFSDHGLRGQITPYSLWNKNILYYRNVKIDTNLVNKNGLIDLIKSIKY